MFWTVGPLLLCNWELDIAPFEWTSINHMFLCLSEVVLLSILLAFFSVFGVYLKTLLNFLLHIFIGLLNLFFFFTILVCVCIYMYIYIYESMILQLNKKYIWSLIDTLFNPSSSVIFISFWSLSTNNFTSISVSTHSY